MPPNSPRFLNILRPKICPRLDLTDFSAAQEMKLLGEICKSCRMFFNYVSWVQTLVIFRQATKFRLKSQRFFTNFHTQKVTDSFIFKKFQKTDKKEQLFLLLIFGEVKLQIWGTFLIKIFKISETKYRFWQILKFRFINWFHEFDYVSTWTCNMK